ncbi:cell division protein FtsQ/DivIB [Patescibacteria group bacterium]
MKNKSHWAKDRKIKKHQKEQYNFLRLVSHIFLVVFLIVLIYVVIFSKFFKITTVTINGIKNLSYEDIEGELSSYLDGKYLYIFPRNNFLFLRENNVDSLLTNKFKKIKKVQIKKIFPGTAGIYLTERDSLLLWCLESDCYMVDEDGKAYEKVDVNALSVSENDLIRLYDLSNKYVNEGDYILKSDYASFVLGVKNELWSGFGLAISNEFKTSSRLADEVILSAVDGWDLYLDSTIPIDKTLNTLRIFLTKEISIEDANDLEYIDLRVEDKIFYKSKEFKGDEQVSDAVIEDLIDVEVGSTKEATSENKKVKESVPVESE